MSDLPTTKIMKLGPTIIGEHGLAPLLYSDLSDDEIVAIMQRLARGEPPGFDLSAHQLTETEWRRRREEQGRALPPLAGADGERHHKRRSRKRRARRR